MQLRKHLITASYVDDSMSKLDGEAKSAGITILGEMGLDPGIGNVCQNIFFLSSLLFLVRWASTQA